MSKDAPVVGLLFGQWTKSDRDDDDNDDNNKMILKIVDADDIPTDRSEAAKSQVSLHHAVFPLHDVVGWYRVGTSEQPTADDVRVTQELKAHYHAAAAADDADDEKPFFFSLLQVKHPHPSSHKEPSHSGNEPKAHGTKEAEEEDDDDELPLNLYEIQIHDQAAVLVGVENWSLETSEAERIAVERVVREQPQPDIKASNNATAKDGGTVESPVQVSPFVNYMASVEHSLQAMQDRIKIIMEYLERMDKGEIPPNPSLLRQIQGLILQLGPLQASLDNNSVRNNQPLSESDAHLLSHLAAVAKVVQSVHSYTDKFRTLHESRPTGGRETRRAY